MFVRSMLLMSCIFIFSIASAMAQDNPEQVLNPDNGSFYMLVEGTFTWTEANEDANTLGCNSHLATITSQAETDFLVANGWVNNYWIGGTRNAEGNWEWVTGEPFEYTNWSPNEPSGDGDYLTITFFEANTGAQWNDVPNQLSNPYTPTGYIAEFDSCLTNGSFEQNAPDGNRVIPNEEQATISTDIPSWEVMAGTVDWLGPQSTVMAADGVQFVDLTGYSAGVLTQTFSTAQCATYNVVFAMSGITSQEPAQKDLTLSAGNTIEQFSFNGNDNAWEDRSMSFIATADTTTLTFTSLVEGSFGPQIDNVRINPEISTIGFTAAELADTTWQFKRADGTLLAETFVLNADGTIGGYDNVNEDHWAVVNGSLVIYSVDNVPSTCFSDLTTDNDVNQLQGIFLLDPSVNITHVLQQVTTP